MGGREREALERLETYIPMFPYNTNAKIVGYAGLMAMSLARSDQSYTTALAYLIQSIGLDPKNSYFIHWIMVILEQRQDYEQMETIINELHSANPNEFFIMSNRFHLYFNLLPPSIFVKLGFADNCL